MPSQTYSRNWARPAAEARWATPRSPDRPTFGPAVAKLAAVLGTPLLPWQRQVVDVALEVLPDGRWAFPGPVLATTPRQSGKTTLLGPVFLHRALTTGGRTWLTAQRREAARRTWLEIVQRVQGSPLAGQAVVRRSNGGEELGLPGGGSFGVFAPSEDALHGTTNQAVAIDEGWAFDPVQGSQLLQAILPTFSTTGGQLWVVSTAGTAAHSQWLRGMVDAGRAAVEAGQREGLAYFEWSLPDDAVDVVEAGVGRDASETALEDALDALEAAHPAAGLTLRRDALAQAAQVMEPAEVLRAYGNRWTQASESIIPGHLWARCRAVTWPRPEAGQVALAYDVALDRSDAAVAAAWRDRDGQLRVDVVEHRDGAGWLPERLQQLADTWQPVGIGHDRAGPAQDVADGLRRGGLALVGTTSRDYAAACAAFLAGVQDLRLSHPGSPALDRAVAAVSTRPLGDAWAWSRRGSAGSISPLVAATLALWALDHGPEPVPAPLIYSSR